ncbi:unnamed protein product, partial [Rotaria sp. Silwood2]
MRWVNEHETSPLSRQPLHPNEIFSDENTPMTMNAIAEVPSPIEEARAPILETQAPAIHARSRT